MGKEKHKEERVVCPVGQFFLDLERVSGKRSKFFEHLNQSRIELLKAFKSLVDERIEILEKKGRKKDKSKMTRIDLE